MLIQSLKHEFLRAYQTGSWLCFSWRHKDLNYTPSADVGRPGSAPLHSGMAEMVRPTGYRPRGDAVIDGDSGPHDPLARTIHQRHLFPHSRSQRICRSPPR